MCLLETLSNHKECAGCEGKFQHNERVYLDTINNPYCEVCYGERETR